MATTNEGERFTCPCLTVYSKDLGTLIKDLDAIKERIKKGASISALNDGIQSEWDVRMLNKDGIEESD